MNKSKQASVECSLSWESADALHMEKYYFPKVNFWRDLFPGDLSAKLAAAGEGTTVQEHFEAGEIVPPYDEHGVHLLNPNQIRRKLHHGGTIRPHIGRFYPRGIVTGVTETLPQDRRPFRYLGRNDSKMAVDFNHPLARYPLTVGAHLVRELDDSEEHGDRSNDLAQDAADNGPGLQAPLPGQETDFLSDNRFDRLDPSDDAEFYATPRLVNHIDSVAMSRVRELYGRLLHPFERIGLVLEYSRKGGHFSNLQTESVRGLPRPTDDKYIAQTLISDPIFAVWGTANGGRI
jgi:hypothetical protein